MVEGAPPAVPFSIHVDAPFEQPLHAVVVVPVVLANQHQREILVRQPARLHQQLHRPVVVGLGGVIDRLFVVGIGAALEQQTRQLRVMRHAGRAVEHALPFRRRLMPGFEKSGRGARAGVEQRPGRAQERIRSCRIETQVLREAEMGEGIPSVRSALGRRTRRIISDEMPDAVLVAENRGNVDVRCGDLGMRRQNRSRLVQRTVPDTRLDEIGHRRVPSHSCLPLLNLRQPCLPPSLGRSGCPHFYES